MDLEYIYEWDQNKTTMADFQGLGINAYGSRMKIEQKTGHTRVQHAAISSNIDSNRAQRAAVYCGTIALVGSVLTLER